MEIPPLFCCPMLVNIAEVRNCAGKIEQKASLIEYSKTTVISKSVFFFPLGGFYVVQPVYIGSVTKHNVSIVVLIRNMLVSGSITNTMNRWSVDLLRTGFQPCMIQTHPGIRKVAGIVSIKPACLIITIKRRL